jgi:hypothetical protein
VEMKSNIKDRFWQNSVKAVLKAYEKNIKVDATEDAKALAREELMTYVSELWDSVEREIEKFGQLNDSQIALATMKELLLRAYFEEKNGREIEAGIIGIIFSSIFESKGEVATA